MLSINDINLLKSQNEGLKKQNEELQQLAKEREKYKQALDEIKEYTRKQFCDNCEDIGSTEYSCHCEYCEYQEYLDIINKAKGENKNE